MELRLEIFLDRFNTILQEQKSRINAPLIIVSGLSDYVDFSIFRENIADESTFDVNGNSTIFNKDWFINIFSKIISASDFLILSHQQYAYIIDNLKEDFFKDRAIIIFDNIRTLYPITSEEYIEKIDENGLEGRPDDLPIYQSEQIKIDGKYFYSLKRIDNNAVLIPFFCDKKPISKSNFEFDNSEVIDISSNEYAVDLFINECISLGNFSRSFIVKTYAKRTVNETNERILEFTNSLLSLFGGGIFSHIEKSVDCTYTPSEDALRLLKQYWGENASFRDINVYTNPDYGKTVSPISQGLIVDTIIKEYKVGASGFVPRDIFITAPTGAGKSLLFQIPAFYASENNDITIVISPLKALMTDQVVNLKAEHKYFKVAFINSDLNFIDRESIIKKCKNGEVDILYLSPESLLSYDIHYFIGDRKLGLMIIDEAHLITTWGRDFRVDYWFLGNHINKIRKYNNATFPLVALTATAVYGGTNDMVFESISSLYMHDPYKFIGEVRRNDIEFVIDTHDDYSFGSYDSNKEEETISFIKSINEIGCKTIIYAPYKRHVERLSEKARDIAEVSVCSYHGGMSADDQNVMYNEFRTNKCKVMICTKAFGMGIDIPDIQCIYHHAPSGLLPDYVQEIGRAARQKNMIGFAAISFSPSDLRYSKQLFGMSSLKTYQLRAVLQKIWNYFEANGRKRNMLISANDFAYIFNMSSDVDQKVSTALMMIEKDYLIKKRFNVLIARPKSLFSQVFARTNQIGIERLFNNYSDCFSVLFERNGYSYIQLNLDKIWTRYFSDISFPRLKSDFYRQQFLNNENIELTPILKLTYFIEKSNKEVISVLEHILDAVAHVLSDFNRQHSFFKEKTFNEKLSNILGNSPFVEKLSSFILSTYTGRVIGPGSIEDDAFLQRRRQGFVEEFQVFNSNFEAKFAQLRSRVSKMFSEDKTSITRYVSIKESSLINYMRIGALFEILKLGTFVSQGGEDPKIFIRINDPRQISKDCDDTSYINHILESVKNRHKSSCSIFEHFFTRYFDNNARWNMIEDFFLGASTDDLLSKYSGGVQNRTDIIKYINDNITFAENNDSYFNSKENVQEFAVREGGYYYANNYLTIENRTLSIKQWLCEDPVLLHRTICLHKLQIEKNYYRVLMSKLQNNYREYYRDFMGLKMYIDFPKYDKPVMALVPYNNEPVAFYIWWKNNQNKVTLTMNERIVLFLAVEKINPNRLLKEHKKLINK